MGKGHFAPDFNPHFGFADIAAAVFAGRERTHP